MNEFTWKIMGMNIVYAYMYIKFSTEFLYVWFPTSLFRPRAQHFPKVQNFSSPI